MSFLRVPRRPLAATALACVATLGLAPSAVADVTPEPQSDPSATASPQPAVSPSPSPEPSSLPSVTASAEPTPAASPEPSVTPSTEASAEASAPSPTPTPSPSLVAPLARLAAEDIPTEVAQAWPLVVSEIMADHNGADLYEYVEVTNLSDAEVSLSDGSISLAYIWDDADSRDNDVPLSVVGDVTIAAGATAVLWNIGADDVAEGTLADFRAYWSLGDDVQVEQMYGQGAFRNGGDRGVRIVGDEDAEVSRAYYRADDVASHLSAHFGTPAQDDVTSLPVWLQQGDPTPGVVDTEAFATVPQGPDPIEPIVVNPEVAAEWPLVVSEVVADHPGSDLYEYIELTNLTTEDIDFTTSGYSLAYAYGAGNNPDSDVAMSVDADLVIPAGRAVMLWNPATAEVTEETLNAFRDYWSVPETTVVAPVTGVNAMANSGDRAIRVLDSEGEELVRAQYSGGTTLSSGTAAMYGAPTLRGDVILPVFEAEATPTPGLVDAAAFDVSLDRVTDPDLVTPMLTVTELLPDSTNAGGGDGYEFIEVYNASDAPLAWEDFTLRYLYPNSDLSISSSTLWASQPRSAMVEPGQAIVVWVKNGGNQDLTAADFNDHFGTDLVAGENLLETHVGGMANGSPRGMDVMTNTEVVIGRAFYNVGSEDDTQANQGIQYGVPADNGIAPMLGLAPASPGTVTSAQVNEGLTPAVAAGDAPHIDVQTLPTFTPGTDTTFKAVITDDVLVRTATLTVSNDVDTETLVLNLVPGEGDTYSAVVPGADTLGKGEFTYEFSATDGYSTVSSSRAAMTSTVQKDPLRLNVNHADYISGEHVIAAATDSAEDDISLLIDDVEVETYPELEAAPVFAFEATATDAYFRNGVVMGDEVLTVFDEGYYAREVTVTADLPLQEVNPGEEFSVRIYAGTKAAPEVDLNENNDNFNVRNLRLVLPDGRTLRPLQTMDPEAWIYMGDSGGAVDYLEATFLAPDDAFAAHAYAWDTTAQADATHVVTARHGEEETMATVHVDNTAPAVVPNVEAAEVVHGDRDLTAAVTDAGAGVDEVNATLNGRRIYFPHAISSLTGKAGDYVLSVTAADRAGNSTTKEVEFSIADEQPSIDALSPVNGAAVDAGEVLLEAEVSDPTGDPLEVTFVRGSQLEIGEAATVSTGATTTALAVDRADATAITAAEVDAIAQLDDDSLVTSSDAKLPYVLLTTEVEGDGEVRVRWDGTSNANAKVLLYVLDPAANAWVEMDRHVTSALAAENTAFGLEAVVSASRYAVDGELTALVQHSEGYAGDNLSTRSSSVQAHHPDDTPRSAYDFTLAWESDTQYYNQDGVGGYSGIYDRQLSIHEYLLERRNELNLQYMAHNGDIVNTSTDEAQWLRADPAYAMLDDAGLPYGVLAGNHDVNQATNDYTNFSQWFGASRYDSNPWWGGDHLDNRGHYDLITAGGIDFLFLYMGWAPGTEQIDWMNDILAQYPERVAFIQLHEFMLTTGGLGPIPQRIMDEVVATNPNVRAVTSGHYHDAYTRQDSFDDDGDGVNDRTVTSMLFDYQGLPNGGEGYMRLLHFDNQSQSVRIRTYSDYLYDYDADHPTLEPDHQDVSLSYDVLGIDVVTKELATDSFRADSLTDQAIASSVNVPSGSTVSASWTPGDGQHSWFVRAEDEHGGVAVSEVRALTVSGTDAGNGGTDSGGSDGSDGGADGSDGGMDGSDNGSSSADDAPTLTLSVPEVAAGGTFSVQGEGFEAGEQITFTLFSDPVHLGTVTATADGALNATLAIPTTVPAGQHTLVAAGGASGLEASVELTVTDAPITSPDADDADGGTGSGAQAAGDLPTTGTQLPWQWLLLVAAAMVAAGGVAVASRRARGRSEH